MTPRRWTGAVFGAAVVTAGLLDVLLVDRGHIEAVVWGGSIPLFWALLGLAGAAAAAGLAWGAARAGLLHERDPYDDEGGAGG